MIIGNLTLMLETDGIEDERRTKKMAPRKVYSWRIYKPGNKGCLVCIFIFLCYVAMAYSFFSVYSFSFIFRVT